MPISNGMFLLIVLVFSLASAICAGITAAMVVYDNSKSGLGAITVQEAIDEILTENIEKKGDLNIIGKINGVDIFIKTPMDQETTCGDFCRSDWGGKNGQCIGAKVSDTGEFLSCGGAATGKVLTCVCIGF